MRVVGYVRESGDPAGASAFAQQEAVRRYATEQGHHVVAFCQDSRVPGAAPTRDGYLSMLGVVAAGGVEAVVVPGISTFSSDAIVQEIILWDLRSCGIKVVSTEAVDLQLLDDTAKPAADRLVIRDVLQRVEEHARGVGAPRLAPTDVLPPADVMVQIIAADAREATER